ncbi:alpha/beta hydrolase [Pedobacter sp. JY14-1]|uniref:alpha/beta hydrolase n=1 Tax=Pedobacter sp. JY14-1 TaxID=3034151 RepID=UPI0023E0A704|nr:alpha/beta hydrolase [Pedobacter sp. JY14-1]
MMKTSGVLSRSKLLLSLAALSLLLTTSCKKDRKEEAKASETISDISYGASVQQKMDVYLPEGRNAETRVIFFIHGGGFFSGDKANLSAIARELSAKGFAVFNINYRLVDITGVLNNPPAHQPSVVKIADQLEDIRMAVNLALSKSGEWTFRRDHWYIAGHSAGGTLAMLYAYGDQNKGQFRAVANLAGATNFAFSDESELGQFDPKIIEVIYRAVGAEPRNENKLAYMAVSPYWVVSRGKGIPTLNIRPQFNQVYDLPDGSQAEYQRFTDLLNAKSVVNKWVEVTGADHGFSRPADQQLVLHETVSFFDGH